MDEYRALAWGAAQSARRLCEIAATAARQRDDMIDDLRALGGVPEELKSR